MVGYGNGYFGPNNLITREQLASTLYRYAQKKGEDTAKATENINTLSYEDIFTTSEWAAEGMHYNIAIGVIQGNGGYVRPLDNATRAEAATMMMRFCERFKNEVTVS